MAVSARRPFDPAGHFVVACEELVCAAGRLRRGAPFPIGGMSSQDLLQLWVALQIDNAPSPDPDAMTEAELEAATAPAPAPAPSPPPKRHTRR